MAILVPDAGRVATPKAGGDSSVERDKLGRPRIIVGCQWCADSGTIPSPKTGRQIKCVKCSGEGANRKVSYTRVTTYIDVLDPKDNLMAWGERMVLLGTAIDPTLLDNVKELAEEQADAEQALADLPDGVSKIKVEAAKARVRAPRDALNRKAQVAKDKGGANKGSEKGTELHDYTELRDMGKPMPRDIDPVDAADIEAYHAGTCNLVDIYLMEKLMVNDDLKVAGTPDRVSHPKMPLIAPDGTLIDITDLLITDLKTGRVDFGALKIAMQLSVYANSKLYKPDGEREGIKNLRTDWGLVMHLPAGQAKLTIYWVDLRLGYEAVHLAGAVRAIRSKNKQALLPF